MTTYTVDASVFINAFNPYETGHDESHRLLALMQEQAAPIIAPTLLLPEVSATVARGQDDTELARRFAVALIALPHLVLVPLDAALARQAIDVAAQLRLRGSDAVYATVAIRFGCTLVTLDQEMRDRTNSSISVFSPADLLAAWPRSSR